MGRVATLKGLAGVSELGASAGLAISTTPIVATITATATTSARSKRALAALLRTFTKWFYVRIAGSVTPVDYPSPTRGPGVHVQLPLTD
jgi:hypothetical protein